MERTTVRARLISVLAGVAMTLGMVTVAAPASAASGNVYYSFPTWLGNCPNGGKVTRVLAATSLASTTRWDTGDDLVYLRSELGVSRQVSAQLYCEKGLFGSKSYYVTVARIVKPTRAGQTVWIGPAGVRYN